MPSPTLSIITPFKNAAKFLPETIRSVQSNTLQDWEWLCISDNSDKESFTILRDAADTDPRIKLLHSPGTGIVPALNYGIEQASTNTLFRLDADDICMPTRFKTQKAFLDSHPNISLVSSLVMLIWDMPYNKGFNQYINWVNGCLSHSEISNGLFIESPLVHPSVAFRKSAIEKLGGYRDFEGPEDYDLWLRMKEAGLVFGKINEMLLKWRIYSNSLSRSDARYTEKAFEQRKFRHLLAVLPNLPISQKALYVWGAGKYGGRLARTLLSNKIALTGFIDIDPKKLATKRHGLPVQSPERIPPNNGEYLYICYVTAWKAREIIQNHLEHKGYRAGRDYIIL